MKETRSFQHLAEPGPNPLHEVARNLFGPDLFIKMRFSIEDVRCFRTDHPGILKELPEDEQEEEDPLCRCKRLVT